MATLLFPKFWWKVHSRKTQRLNLFPVTVSRIQNNSAIIKFENICEFHKINNNNFVTYLDDYKNPLNDTPNTKLDNILKPLNFQMPGRISKNSNKRRRTMLLNVVVGQFNDAVVDMFGAKVVDKMKMMMMMMKMQNMKCLKILCR